MGIGAMRGEESRFLTWRSGPFWDRATAGTFTVSRASRHAFTTNNLNTQFPVEAGDGADQRPKPTATTRHDPAGHRQNHPAIQRWMA